MDRSPVNEHSRTRVTARLRELRFDSGSPALDLVATVGRRPTVGIERLGDVGRLRAWAEGAGYPLADGEATEQALKALCELREVIFDVLTDAMTGGRIDRSAAAFLNEAAAFEVAPPRLVLTRDGRPAEGGRRRSFKEVRALIARDAIEILTDPATRARLKNCDSPVCRMIFLDSPGGRSRRWCSMRQCGNTSKAAAFRQRAEIGVEHG